MRIAELINKLKIIKSTDGNLEIATKDLDGDFCLTEVILVRTKSAGDSGIAGNLFVGIE